MTAEEIFNEKYGKSASILLAYKQDIVKMLTEFATLKCKEQKRILKYSNKTGSAASFRKQTSRNTKYSGNSRK